MIIFKITKNQGFTISIKMIFSKNLSGVKMTSPLPPTVFLGLNFIFLLTEYWLRDKSFTSIHLPDTNFNALELFINLDILYCSIFHNTCLNSSNIFSLFPGEIFISLKFLGFLLGFTILSAILFPVNSQVPSVALWTFATNF